MSLHVAIAMVSFRSPVEVSSCLAALEASNYADFEVAVCENGGPDAFIALRDAVSPRLKGGQVVRTFLAERNLGYAGGVNLCLSQTDDADAWWILNPDTAPEPDALGALVDRLLQGDCDAVGGVIYRPNQRVQSYGGRWRAALARAESIGLGRHVGAAVSQGDVERVQSYINGAAMLVGRRFLAAAGPMREDYFLYCEEVEWCIRACRMGMRLGFAPGARISHSQGATTGAGLALRISPRLPVYLNERNRMLLTRDLFPRRYPFVIFAALAVLILRYAKVGAWRQLGYALEGWRAGLRNERGPPLWTTN